LWVSNYAIRITEDSDNQGLTVLTIYLYTGIFDSSGIRMFYAVHSPKENAGILLVGHSIAGHMIIPPHVERYTVKAFCSQKCIGKVSVLVIC